METAIGVKQLLFPSTTGEPQHKATNQIYVRGTQLGIGLEWEHSLTDGIPWLNAYSSIGAGWRDEKLIGDSALAGERSGSASRAALLLGTGLRVNAARFSSRWNYRVQLGLNAWVPSDDAQLQIGSLSLQAQKPTLAILLGMTFDFE